jgi:hypothetical protein
MNQFFPRAPVHWGVMHQTHSQTHTSKCSNYKLNSQALWGPNDSDASQE